LLAFIITVLLSLRRDLLPQTVTLPILEVHQAIPLLALLQVIMDPHLAALDLHQVTLPLVIMRPQVILVILLLDLHPVTMVPLGHFRVIMLPHPRDPHQVIMGHHHLDPHPWAIQVQMVSHPFIKTTLALHHLVHLHSVSQALIHLALSSY
jgi:hypothetical protein